MTAEVKRMMEQVIWWVNMLEFQQKLAQGNLRQLQRIVKVIYWA